MKMHHWNGKLHLKKNNFGGTYKITKTQAFNIFWNIGYKIVNIHFIKIFKDCFIHVRINNLTYNFKFEKCLFVCKDLGEIGKQWEFGGRFQVSFKTCSIFSFFFCGIIKDLRIWANNSTSEYQLVRWEPPRPYYKHYLGHISGWCGEYTPSHWRCWKP